MKNTVLLIFFLSIILNSHLSLAQTTIEWESGASDNGATVSSTELPGNTITISAGALGVDVLDGASIGGSTGNVMFAPSGFVGDALSMTVSFASAVNITSVYHFDPAASGATLTFTPTGGSNGVVMSSHLAGGGKTAVLNWTGVTSFTITGSPNGNYAIDEIVFAAANAAPVIGGTVAGQNVNDNANVSPFSAITVADADGNNLTATITLDNNAKGVLTGADAGAGPYTMTSKTPAAMQTAIRALVFNPTDNRAAVSETTTFTVVVNDGTVDATNNTTTVISSAVAPVISQVTPVTTPTNDNTPNYTFTTNETGTFSLGGSCGTSSSTTINSTGNQTITLTQTNNSSALADGTYANCTITVTDAGGKASAPLAVTSFTVDTQAPATPGAPDLIAGWDTGTSTTDNITSNTQPRFGGSTEANASIKINSSINGQVGTTTANGVGSWLQTITGTLSQGTHNITFTATDAAGNESASSAALSVVVDTSAPTLSSSSPADNATGVNTSADITLTFNENIAFGTGNIEVIDETNGSNSFTIDAANPGVQASISGAVLTINPSGNLDLSSNYSVRIAATAIDDFAGNSYAGITNGTTLNFGTNNAPTVDTNTGITVAENGTGTIDSGKLHASDAETGSDAQKTFTVTTAVTKGTLFLDANGNSTFDGGDTQLSVNATFTQDDINNVKIKYTSTTDNDISDSFVFTLSDPDGGALTGQTFNITITPVNDAPTATGAPTDVTVIEDAASNFDLSAVTLVDVDGDALTVTLSASAGIFAATTGGGVTIGGSGTGSLTLAGTAANINTYFDTPANIKYTGASNVSGGNAATYTLNANDATVNPQVGSGNIDITAVNDVPTFTIGANRTVAQNAGAQTVNGFITTFDDGDAGVVQTTQFNITGNTNAGLFTAVPAISAAGVLTFTPDAAKFGKATISVTISDNGGTANSGVDTSPAQTFNIFVTPTNIKINEVHAVAGADAEFIEVYNTNGNATSLSGLVMVWFNGGDDLAYKDFDLTGPTSASGFYVIGETAFATKDQDWGTEILQNGPDAVAIYVGSQADFVNGTAPTLDGLVDVIVYGSSDDAVLRAALGNPALQVAGDAGNSISRSPDGTGAFVAQAATPQATNDVTAPTITSVTVPANSTYAVNGVLNFTVNTNENVIVNTGSGIPQLAITIGANTRQAVYQSGSGSQALLFRYTVIAGDEDTNGITVGASLDLNGGTMKDAAGNNLVTTLNSVGATTAVLVDGIAPTVTNVSSNKTNGAYKVGEIIAITVTFSEVVNMTPGCSAEVPQLTLETGTTDRVVDYTSGTGTNTLTFNYTVQAGDTNSDLDYVATNSLALNGSSVADVAGNTANLTLPTSGLANSLGANKNLVIDTTAPRITSIVRQSPATSPTNADALVWDVTFDEAVSNVDAADFTASNTTATITNVTNPSGNIYRVTVSGGDLSNLNATVTLGFAGGQNIADAAGNALANTTPTGANDNNFVVDNTAPRITSIVRQSPATSPTNADALVWDVTFDEAVANVDAADFTASNTTATITNVTNPGGNIYRVTVSGGDLANLNATVTLGFAGGQNIADAAGNALANTTPTGANDNNFVVDNTAPRITSIVRQSPATSPTNADALVWDVTFDEAVANVDAADFIASNTTATITGVTNPSGNIYRVTVSGGDLANLNATVTLSFAGGQNIADAAGNALANTVPTGANDNNFVVDNTASTITSVTSSKADGTYGVGEIIAITVTFGESVNVTGTPQIELETGGVDRTVDYASGSGSTVLTFNYTVQSGDISPDLDYKATNSLSLNGGTINDGAGNAATLTLASPGAANSLGSNKALVINGQPTVSLSVGSASIAEAAGTSSITATLSAISSTDVTVTLAYSGTATSGTDYNNTASTTITITAGNLSASTAVGITATQDVNPEANETIIIDITGVANGTENGSQQQTVTITDDDTPNVQFTVTASNGAESVSTANLTVDLSIASGLTVTVDYAVTGTATGSGTDYTLANGTLTFVPTDVQETISIAGIVDDAILEANETVIITLSNPGNANLGTNTVHTYTINNNDAAAVTIADVSGAENGGAITVTATLDNAVQGGFTVDVSTANGTSTTADNDYTAVTNQTLTFAGTAGETKTFTVTPTADTKFETNETLTISQGNLAATALAVNIADGATVTINNDDTAPTVTLTQSTATFAEAAGTNTVTVTLSAVSGQDVTVTVGVKAGGTATLANDFTLSTTSIVITAGNTTGTATLTAVQDVLDETDETVTIEITGVNNGTENGTQEVSSSITDDDAAPTVTLTQSTTTFAEAAGTNTVTATLSAVSGQDVTVTVGVKAGGTATITNDFTLSTTSIVIAAGNTTGTTTLTAVQDALDETNETVTIEITGVTNGTENGSQEVASSITDDDAAPTVTLTQSTTTFAEAAGTNTITATLSVVSGQDVTVTIGVKAGGTATITNDFTLSTTSIVIAAGNTTGTATLTAVQDVLDETDETVTIEITGVTNGTENGTQEVASSITDDDAAPTVTLSVGSASIAEAAGTSTVTATLSAVSAKDVTVTLAYSGTATSGTDYNNTASTTITITAGNLSASAAVGITATQDVNPEANETIIIDITGVANGTENGSQQQTVTITDDDTPNVQFTVTASNGAESVSTANLTVDLSIASGLTVTVDYAVTGTATGSGTDYTLANGTLTFVPTDVQETISIAGIVDDAILEANETVIITLSNPGNANLGANTSHTYTINNNDAAAVTIADVSGAENGGAITVTATLDNAVQGGFTVDMSTANGTATTADNDYTAVTNQTLTFTGTAGETKTFTVTPTADTKLEANETLTISQGNLAATALAVNIADGATVTINNDDTAPTVTLSVGSATIAEASGTSSITATLSNLSVDDVTVTLAYSGTATSGTDYNNTASTTITITAGNLSASAAVGITATQDVNPEANETIIIDITGVANGTENGSQQQTVTITDDDTPNVQFTVTASNGAESVSTANLTVDLSIASGLTVTVDYAVTGTATGSGTDYTLANGTLTFVPTDVQETISIAGIVDDAILEANETVIITLSNPGNANLGANTSHTYTINNNDAAAVTIADVSGAENGGAITVTATLDNAVQGGFTVDVSTANGTSTTADNDYTAVTNQTLTFTGTAGETKTFTVTPTADTKFETNETLTISQGNLAATALAVNIADGATVTINNDDTASVTIADASGAENGGPITVTATLNNAVQGGFTVDVNTADGTALAATDYTAVTSQTLTFTGTAGETQTFMVTPTNDAVEEATETLTVSMNNLAATTLGVTIADNATVTITDDDDNTAPAGYTVTFDDALINSLEQATSKFTFTGAEVGTTYNYTVSSTGGGTNVTGTGTIATATDKITMADLSGLGDGTLTLSVTLKDASNNTGAAQTASTVHKATIAAPALSPADNSIDILPGADLTMAFAEAMAKGTGNITIKKKSDNSVLETIDVTSSKVTIASGLVTINPDSPILPPATEFYVNIDAGAFKDNAGNNYTGISDNTSWTFTIIAAPVVTSVALPANNTYKIGDVLDFTASFTLPVTTTGTPSIPVTIGTSTKAANLKATAANSATAVFSYTIAEGDLDTDGIAVGTTINLNGGTIKDQFGTDALTALNNIAPGANVKVDGIRAIPAISTSAAPLVNGAFSVTFQYSEAVTGLSVGDITVTNGTASNFTNITAGTLWTADIAPTADGSVTVNLGAGVANDNAGNASAAGTEVSTTFDGTAPTALSLTRKTANPILTASAGFRATFSENVTGVDISDFEVILTGTATGTLDAVTPVDAKTYDITVTGISGQGSIGLDLKDDDSILDAANNPLAGALAGEVYVTNFLPTDLGLSTASIAENNALSAEVGSFTTTDQDATDTHAYALVSGAGDADNGSFLIAGDKLFAGAIFNFEAKASYSIRVRTTDNNGGTFEKPLTITIADVNEAPTAMSLSNDEIDEEDTPGLLVGQMATTDVDNGETFTYSLVTGAGDANNLLFTFSGDELRTAAPIDFESSTTLSIRVRVTDAGGLGYEEVFAITVNNVEIEPIREFDKDKNDAKIKNFFSPNEDGTNDAWVIEDILDNPINEVRVFSQNGTLLFSERNYKNTWRGTYNGKAIPPGTYYYEINVYNGESIIKGFLTIIRSKNN